MLTLIWRQQAREELRAIFDYIAERDSSATERLLDLIETCAEALPAHPFMYRTGRVPGTREAVVHPNYVVVYRVTETAVQIVSVIHARRQYP